MKFPYFKLPVIDTRKKSLLVPWIKVTIKANDKGKDFLMLVDSGADFCIFDRDVAKFLAINITDGELEKTTGIGGDQDIYYFDNIWINVGGCEICTRAGFIDGLFLGGRIAGVLGRQGFFDYFKVCLNQKKLEVELKPHNT